MLRSFQTAPLLLLVCLSAAQEKKEQPRYDMHTFQMVMLKTTDKPLTDSVRAEHSTFFQRLRSDSKAPLAGPIAGDGPLRAVVVLDVSNKEEAEAMVAADPAIKAGGVVAEIHPWWAAKNVIARPAPGAADATYYLGFLSRGPAWTPEVTPAVEELQKQHMANINRLGESGKLVLAGPFSDGGVLRGVFIFFVPTLEDARQLAATDPMVMAGRLKIDLHEWKLPVGVLPPR